MSARVLYLRRTDRGGLLRGVRLVSETTDDVWPAHGDAPGDAGDYAKAATWVQAQLAGTRSTSSIAMVCVDAEGTACTWLTSPTSERAVVSVVARFGAAPDGSRGGGGPVDYYAPSDSEASIQALDEDPTTKKAAKRATKPGAATIGTRRAVLSVADAPARARIDALDAVGVPVEAVAGVAHAMAMVWDPGAPRAALLDAPVDAGPVTAILMQDGNGRLLWCWARAGLLLASGSIRLRTAVMAPLMPGDADIRGFACGPEDASRLTTEWLAWAAQLGYSPGRVVCVLPDAEEAAAFGGELTRLMPGVGVDVATDEDAVGTTLRKAADVLEHTPRNRTASPSGASALLALSARPGRRHRQMHLWRAAALGLLALAIGLAGWRLEARAAEARAAGESWNTKWRELVKTEYPDALRPRPGVTPVVALSDEVRKRQRELVPPERTELTMPVLAELETVSMVISHENVQLESMEMNSATRVTIVVSVPELRNAEAIVESLKKIGGSFVSSWTPTFAEQLLGPQNQPGGPAKRIRLTLRGDWDRALVKASGEATPRKTGGAP
ncbi:MAG: hypothetical protein WC718_09695 [Phycisphaerales bacterium]|jgi:hypothetical protein